MCKPWFHFAVEVFLEGKLTSLWIAPTLNHGLITISDAKVRCDWATNTHNDLLKLTKFHAHLCHRLYPDVGKIRGDANFPLGVSRNPIMCHSPFKHNPKENRFSDVFCLYHWGLFFSPPARETILLRYSPRVFQKMLQKNIQINTPAFCPF